MMATALRVAAIAIAILAITDPSLTLRRVRPPSVDVRVGSAGDAGQSEAARRRVLDALGTDATFTAAGPVDSVVLVDPVPADATRIPDDIPFSVVTTSGQAQTPRIIDVKLPAAVVPGQLAVVEATILSPGAPRPVRVTLERSGITLATRDHRPESNDETFRVSLAHAPAGPGLQNVRVAAAWAELADSGGRASEEAVDAAVVARDRRFRVLVYERRPSWAAVFVRRALEADAVFEVAALARLSRGIDVRAGDPPSRIAEESLRPFDTVVVGSPEELSRAEVAALDRFAAWRGGAVVFLPDRAPSGAYLRLVGVERFDEALLASPVALESADGILVTGSEFALPRSSRQGDVALAALRQGTRVRPVILSWPHGRGRVVFSGALDAWRYRADRQNGFARFWTTTIANLAASAPRALELDAQPAVTAPGARVSVRASVRATEFVASGEGTEVPAIRAAVVGEDGLERSVRLWPAAETGVFEGGFEAQAAGRYVLRADAGGVRAEVPLLVEDGVRPPPDPAAGVVSGLAQASGGVVVHHDDLAALRVHVRGLPRPAGPVRVHPMRSPWWIAPFAVALCGEWAMRRRRGRR